MQLERILKDARDVILPFCQQVSLKENIYLLGKLKSSFVSWNAHLTVFGRIEMHPLRKQYVGIFVLFCT
jgi:hypothetical protein